MNLAQLYYTGQPWEYTTVKDFNDPEITQLNKYYG